MVLAISIPSMVSTSLLSRRMKLIHPNMNDRPESRPSDAIKSHHRAWVRGIHQKHAFSSDIVRSHHPAPHTSTLSNPPPISPRLADTPQPRTHWPRYRLPALPLLPAALSSALRVGQE
ncbi:hypothetical protein EJ04DRAFT_64844 [Polyplosphaeria fusca]|uniref:Uncharacterized protein n=1 Tax=Polyplosphaeria fusca TaxID=682080 RepID=A0A9P4QRP7_9PLEO|nr:hypothetical protein EJ04DRAFT_64844 [Polyplosphaeria fusca]